MTRPPLSQERWQQVEECFQAALKLPPGECDAFLAGACDGDSELRREVESLLAAHTGSDSFMLDPVAAEAAAVGEERSASLVGQRLGPYKLFRKLGQGGMGSVYLAGRADDEYRQQVTVKLIKPGLDGEGILRRFRNERQILASLDHPNIARLLDGGTAENGLPYLVMEYIEGEPIDKYCDRHKLSIDERLELFRKVCEAVHTAHQNLVVHRDIKPGNILVTAEGEPKLLDFGIAKLLNPELQAQTINPTGVDPMRLMTPGYASPEQIRGEAITTASDVYSLGVLLYELLTARRPYHFTDSRPQEIERVVCETEPEKPSTVVRRELERTDEEPLKPEQVSRLRGCRPEELQRRLAGDLDNIVLKAMRKEPRNRYDSVLELREDLRRHRQGLPVIARPSTFGYRAGKFVRRHTWGVAFIVLLAAFAVAMAVQSVLLVWERDRADQARQTAEIEREVAESERETSRQIAEFLVDLFELADPYAAAEAAGDKVTAVDLLDRGAERVAKLEDQPEIQASLMNTMGKAYLGLGLYDAAEQLVTKALDIRRNRFSDRSPEVAESLSAMGAVLYNRSDFQGAVERLQEALEIRRGLGVPRRVAESLNDLGEVLYAQGDSETASKLFQEAVEIGRGVEGADLELVGSLTNLGAISFRKREYERALERFQEASTMVRRHGLDDEHPQVTIILNNTGMSLLNKGDYAHAEALFLEVLKKRRERLGENHPGVARVLNNLALAHLYQSELERAEQVFQEALAIYHRMPAQVNQNVALTQLNLGTVFYFKGEYGPAWPLVSEALTGFSTILGQDHVNVGRSLEVLAALLIEKGDFLVAESRIHESLKILRGQEDDWRIRYSETTLGACLGKLGRYDVAEPLLLDGYSIVKDHTGVRSPFTRDVLRRLVSLYEAWAKPEEVAKYRALLLEIDGF